MAITDDYDFQELKNESEQVVLKELERQLALQDDELCRCKDCVLDMAGMAFNSVRPRYRSSLLGLLYAANALEDKEYAESVEHAVAIAIARVKANPLHD